MAVRFNDDDGMILHSNDESDYPLSSSFTFPEFVDACGSESSKERVNAAQHLSDAIRKTADFDFSMNDFFDSLEKLFECPGEVRKISLEKLREVFSELSVKAMPKTLADLAHFTVNELVKTLDEGDENEHSAALSTITYLFENDFIEQSDIVEFLVPALFRLFFKQCEIRNRCNETQFTNMINIVAVLCFVANQIDTYPRDWAYYHFLAQFSAFFADDSCVIRKLSLSTMGALAKRFGQTFTERCLVPHLIQAINDTNSRVHMSTSSQLGPIIATFAEPKRTGMMFKDGHLESLSLRRPTTASIVSDESNDKRNDSISSDDSDGSVKKEAIDSIEEFELDGDLIEHQEELQKNYDVPDGFYLPDAPKIKTRERTYSVSSISSVDSDSVLTASPNFRDTSSTGWTRVKNYKQRNLFDEEDEKPAEKQEDDSQMFTLKRWPYEPNKNIVSLNDPDFCLDDIMSEDLDVNDLDSQLDKLDVEQKAGAQNGQEKISMIDESPSNISTVKTEGSLYIELGVSNTIPRLNLDEISPPDKNIQKSEDEQNSNVVEKRPTPRPTSLFPLDSDDEDTSQINYWSFDAELDFEEVQRYTERSENLNKVSLGLTDDELNGNMLIEPPTLVPQETQYDAAFPPIGESNSQDHSSNESSTTSSPTKRSWADVVRHGNDEDPDCDLTTELLTPKQTTEGFWKRRFDFARKPLDFMKKTAAQSMLLPQTTMTSTVTPSTTSTTVSTSATSALIAKIRPMTQNMGKKVDKAANLNSNSNITPRPETVATVAPFRQFTEKVKQRISGATERKSDEMKPDIWEQKADLEAEEFQSKLHVLQRRHLENAKRYLTDGEYTQLMHSEQDVIPQKLFEALSQMQQQDEMENKDEHQIILARCFPAVAYTFGSQRWIFIKALYLSLASHQSPTIRLCLAQSIHEIAKIIGQKKTDRDLVPIFQRFVLDTPDVQKGLLTNLYDFFKVCSEDVRLRLASELNLFNTCDSRCEWRLRHKFIDQLCKMAHLFKPYHVNVHLIPFALAFATDRIAEVRKGGVRMLAEVLALLIKHEHSACKISGLPIDAPNAMPLSNAFLKELRNGFWSTMSWRKRQSFAQMMEILAKDRLLTPKTICNTFKQPLIELSHDPIHNVRQYFCSVVDFLGRERIESIDVELHSAIIGRLHEMAARDEDLEIRTLSRTALGTVDPKKQELDLSQRDLYLAAAEQKDRQVRDEDEQYNEVPKSPKSPRTYAANENPEISKHLDLPKIYASIQKKLENTSAELNRSSTTSVSTSSATTSYTWVRPRLRRDGVSVEDDKIIAGSFKGPYEEDEGENEEDDVAEDFNTTLNDLESDELDFQSHDLEYDEPTNDFMKKHPTLIVAKVAPQPSNDPENLKNESTV